MIWNRIMQALGRRGIRAGMTNRNTIMYLEDGRSMTIAGELLDGAIVVYTSTILSWDDGNGDFISVDERQRITQNLKRYLESQGESVIFE
jgi:hypothetical protein